MDCSSNLPDFDRLLKAQQEGITKTKSDLGILRGLRDDCANVVIKLQELQKCFTQNAYIPLSHKALVPGKLVHTNEVLVHLGGRGDFFAEVSTHQAVGLLEQRIRRFDETIEALEKQKDLINERLKYTSEFACVKSVRDASAGEDEVEIQEECDSDTELRWRQKHIESRRREREELRTLRSPKLIERRVTFKEPLEMSGSSDSSLLPDTIHFKHSSVAASPMRSTPADLSSLSPAEAVNLYRQHGSISSSSSIIAKPFGDIKERQPIEDSMSPDSVTNEVPRVSRFRSSRMKHE